MQYFIKSDDPLERKISLEEAISEYNESFEIRWRAALGAFAEEQRDSMVLLGPSSYLFKLGRARIAADPQIRRRSDLEKVKDTILPFFQGLSAILITHEHDDHFDKKLTNLLKDTNLVWYLPSRMKERWIEESGLRKECMRFVSPGDEFDLDGVHVRAFHSPHVPNGATFEMDERGYELTTEKGRILLPGDIREYSYAGYPPMQGADYCFAHVWAGNNTVTPAEYLPRMEQCADFFARFAAKEYFLGHLYEIGREQHVMWDTEHAEILTALLKSRLPETKVCTPILGRRYPLFEG